MERSVEELRTLLKPIKACFGAPNGATGANVLPLQPRTSLAPADLLLCVQLHLRVFTL